MTALGTTDLDLSLYLITDTAMCGRRGVAATVAAAVAGGATVVQLRDHHAGDDEFVGLGLAVREVLTWTGVPLIVDDRVHLAHRIGADGVHVGRQDMPPAQARDMLGEGMVIGLSVSTVDEVHAALATGPDTVDYLGVGPVWATATKPDHGDPIGPEGVARIAAAGPWPLVAVGGITAERVRVLRHAAVAGVAVVSAICAADEPAEAAASLRASFQAQP